MRGPRTAMKSGPHLPQLEKALRSEEHTSELQSLTTNSYAVFCLNKKTYLGLPWWRRGWESAFRCRGRGFVSRSGRDPRAAERLGS